MERVYQVEGMTWTKVMDGHMMGLEVTVRSAQIRERMHVGGVLRNKMG